MTAADSLLHRPPACPQIVVAPPYETCNSLHNDNAGAMRVKKVVSVGTHTDIKVSGLLEVNDSAHRSAASSWLIPLLLCPTCLLQLDAERLRLQAG